MNQPPAPGLPEDDRPERSAAPNRHVPVLLAEVLAMLDPRPGQIYLDCTAGLGGHASAVARRLAGASGSAGSGLVILADVDPGNLARASAAVREAAPGVGVEAIPGNFAWLPGMLPGALPKILARHGLEAGRGVDLVLADLGFSSNQVDDPSRGLSFMRDGPLDMRLDPTLPTSARELVASLPERELAEVIRRYGEEDQAGRIARKIVSARGSRPINTTADLAEIVRSACPRTGRIDPATRTFQALRIAVNDEIGTLEAFLQGVEEEATRVWGRAGDGPGAGGRERSGWLSSGARVGIITFHSLEDRPVKEGLGRVVEGGWGRALSKGPVSAGLEEVSANPRSRSAKLRGVEVGVRGGARP